MPRLSGAGRQLDLEVVRGTTLGPYRFRMRNRRTGAPVNLAGATVRAWVQRGASGAKIVDLSVTIELPDVFVISLDPAGTVIIPATRAVWGMTIEWSNGHVDPPVWGNLSAPREVPM
jgi:hypothetical protein